MNKQIKELKELALKCQKIAVENNLVDNTFTEFNKDLQLIKIYQANNKSAFAIYFCKDVSKSKTIEVALYSDLITIPMSFKLKDVNETIEFAKIFINENLGIDPDKMAKELEQKRIAKIETLKSELLNLENEIETLKK